MTILPKWCWFTTADAARMLRMTTRGLRWSAAHKRVPATRTNSGQWLFRSDDVERVMVQRGRGRVQTRGNGCGRCACRCSRSGSNRGNWCCAGFAQAKGHCRMRK